MIATVNTAAVVGSISVAKRLSAASDALENGKILDFQHDSFFYAAQPAAQRFFGYRFRQQYLWVLRVNSHCRQCWRLTVQQKEIPVRTYPHHEWVSEMENYFSIDSSGDSRYIQHI